MPLWGIDVHPRFQSGLSIERAATEVSFMAVKVSEGTSSYYLGAGSADWLRRGKAAGLACLAYHYLRPGSEQEQARVFADALATTGVPGMLDAEAIDSAGRPTLTVAGVRSFLARVQELGGRVVLLYLPRWWWQRLGSPSLAGLPPLWASSYPTTSTGSPWDLYRTVTSDRWAGYGGLPVKILQFAETGMVAGHSPVDVNAYLGTRAQLAALLGVSPDTHPPESPPAPAVVARRPELEDASMFHRTPAPADPNTPKNTWPAEWISITLDPPGGWGGKGIVQLSTSAPGGWIHEAQFWQRPGTGVGTPNVPCKPIPVTPIPGGNERFVGYQLQLDMPERVSEFVVRIAAPGGVHISPRYER